MQASSRGVAPVVVVGLVAAVALSAGGLFYGWRQGGVQAPPSSIATQSKTTCPDRIVFDLPIDISKATSVLYPGQIRGGDFKAHGGFRFDGSSNSAITVTAPLDANVIAGARYP